MTQNKLPASLRRFLRFEKSRLRREFSDSEETEKKIKELVKRLKEEYNKNSTKQLISI